AAHQLAAVRLVPAEGQATTERTVLRNEAQRAERATRVTMVQRSERGRLIVRSASISGEKTRNRNSRVDLLDVRATCERAAVGAPLLDDDGHLLGIIVAGVPGSSGYTPTAVTVSAVTPGVVTDLLKRAQDQALTASKQV